MEFADYNDSLLSRDKIKTQLEDTEFTISNFFFPLDISVIATGFGQLVDEGVIEETNKPIIKIALDRQIIWSELQKEWDHANQYIAKLECFKKGISGGMTQFELQGTRVWLYGRLTNMYSWIYRYSAS
jgi:hypothetical protein